MSEYILKVDDEPQAEALLTYLRSLDFVELSPKQASAQSEQGAIDGVKSFLVGLPNQEGYTQKEVNQALNECGRAKMSSKLRVIIDPNLLASVLIGGRTRDHFFNLVNVADKIDICYADELLTEVEALPHHRYFQEKGITEAIVLDFLRLFTGFSLKVFITSTVKIGRDQNDNSRLISYKLVY